MYLAWQPSFDSHYIFQILHFSKKSFISFSTNWIFLIHLTCLTKHYFINTLRGGFVPPWLRSCAWQNFCHVLSSDLTLKPLGKYSYSFLLIFNSTDFEKIWKAFSLEFCWKVSEQNSTEQYRKLLQTPEHIDLDKGVLFVSTVGTSGGEPWNANITTTFKTKESNRVR